MTKFLFSMICLASVVQATGSEAPIFKFQRDGPPNASPDDDFITTIFVDKSGSVWVGTYTGLAVYDGKQWTKRGFQLVAPLLAKAVIRLTGASTSCGPSHIAEGPPGTIWLGGDFGVWRVRDGLYEEITSSPEIAGMLAMNVDKSGNLWVVQQNGVHMFDGRTWALVLCPYIGKPASYEAPGLHSIAIGTNGNVWIGGTVYGHPSAPWEHEGKIWVVDQGRRKRGEGPPMAPLFEFDGKRWRAFGPPHGLNVESATPDMDERGNLRVRKSSLKQYIREGETWKSVRASDVPTGKQWFLILKSGRSQLAYRDGERIIEVQPTDFQTDATLNIGSEPLPLLHVAEDRSRGCVWLGTSHGLYRIWLEQGN